MDRTLVISESCVGCGMCAKVCIRGHLAVGEDRKAREVESRYSCFECGHCASVCPKGAISFKGVESAESPVTRPVEAGSMAALLRERRSIRWFDRKCTREELGALLSAVRYSPTAENSGRVEYAVVDERFDEFMALLASILGPHVSEHPRLEQFVGYVGSGMRERNNPFTWEGRQLIIAFSAIPIDAAISMEQLELMAYCMGLGGFHSRWMLLAAEKSPERFMSFFPGIADGLRPYAVYVVGHPRVSFRRTVHRRERPVHWM